MGTEILRLYEVAKQLSDSNRVELAAALAGSVGEETSHFDDIKGDLSGTSELRRVLMEAMTLPASARAELAVALVDSLAGESERGIMDAWIAEAQRRLEDFRAGRSEMTPFEEVDAELEALIVDAERAAKS